LSLCVPVLWPSVCVVQLHRGQPVCQWRYLCYDHDGSGLCVHLPGGVGRGHLRDADRLHSTVRLRRDLQPGRFHMYLPVRVYGAILCQPNLRHVAVPQRRYVHGQRRDGVCMHLRCGLVWSHLRCWLPERLRQRRHLRVHLGRVFVQLPSRL
jgi:hypothetical protein